MEIDSKRDLPEVHGNDLEKHEKERYLKVSGRIFNPMRCLAPYASRSKMLIFQIWKRSSEWNAIVPSCSKTELFDWSEIEIRLTAETKQSICRFALMSSYTSYESW
ncbi:hypothetical protein TNCT_480581 [Trichonephila clavata]|uniref:Uncharacterized protein n=1 Tax=Trichonephila clavata TaxID=2740835 RepID=A0A8X6J703_TRICU|nr:hypothetical protein TNCT_480581 [Trichonephila clavata]